MEVSQCCNEHDPGRLRRKHRGKSVRDGMKVAGIVALTFAAAALPGAALFPSHASAIVLAAALLWTFCAAFILFFFRDANPLPPAGSEAIVSPSHGVVDYIDTATEERFLNGPAQRISIYLSLLNVHVQNAPASGSVVYLQHFPGRWSRAIRRDASLRNEHLLVGIGCADGRKLALRLISGIWVRRIVPWVARGDIVECGERIGLIRFGSRVDVFLPLDAHLKVKAGDRVRGGETVLAQFAARPKAV